MEKSKIIESSRDTEVNNKSCDPLRNELPFRLETNKDSQLQASNQTPGIPQPKPIGEIFPWLPPFYAKVRLQIKTDHSDQAILAILRQYIKCIRDDMHNFIRLPNRCFILSKNITRMMLFFKLQNKRFTDSHEYLDAICELLSIYTTLELKYSTKFEESKANAANRISMNYDIHLWGLEERFTLKALLSVKNFFHQREIMRKILKKYLNRKGPCVVQKELPDDLYVMYLTSYKQWKTLEENLLEETKVEDVANAFMRPSFTLRKNPQYAPFIPAYKTKPEVATKSILSQNFSISSLIQAIEQNERKNTAVQHHSIDLVSRYDSMYLDGPSEVEVITLPNVKLEKPEVVATVDLTSSQTRWNDDLLWLDKWVQKARSCKNDKSAITVVGVIEIDDDDADIVEVVTNTPQIIDCELVDYEPRECKVEDISISDMTEIGQTPSLDERNDQCMPKSTEKTATTEETAPTEENTFTNDVDFSLKAVDSTILDHEALDVAGMDIDFPEKSFRSDMIFLTDNTKIDFPEKSYQSDILLLSDNITEKDTCDIERTKELSALEQLTSTRLENATTSSRNQVSNNLESLESLNDSSIYNHFDVSKLAEKDHCDRRSDLTTFERPLREKDKLLSETTKKDSWKIVLDAASMSSSTEKIICNASTVNITSKDNSNIGILTNKSNCETFEEIASLKEATKDSQLTIVTNCSKIDDHNEAISKMMDISIEETEMLISEYEQCNLNMSSNLSINQSRQKTISMSDTACDILTENNTIPQDSNEDYGNSHEITDSMKMIENILSPNTSKDQGSNVSIEKAEVSQREKNSIDSTAETEGTSERSTLEVITNFGNLRTYSKRCRQASIANVPRSQFVDQIDIVKLIASDSQENAEVCKSNVEQTEEVQAEKPTPDVPLIPPDINTSQEPEAKNKEPPAIISPDEDDDDIIKNIAQNVISSTKKAKKRNDSISYELKLAKIPENTLLDLPIFSSSEENDDSGDSNILSILDESDNTEERNLDINEERKNDDDMPVRKISPKARIDDSIKRTEGNDVVFRMTANTHLPLSSETIFTKRDYASNPTVVFSTSIQRNKTIDTSDAVFDTDDNFHNVPQPEITSPPIEEFTKSDKTLFKTFLNNVCDDTATFETKRIHTVHDPIIGKSFMKTSDISQKLCSNKRSTATSTDNSDINDLMNILPSTQRRKTVSFLDTQVEKPHKEDRPMHMHGNLSQLNNQHINRMKKDYWTASINTYRPKTNPVVTSTSFQPCSTFLSTKAQQSVPNAPNPEFLKKAKRCTYFLKNLYDDFNIKITDSNETYSKIKSELVKKKPNDSEKYKQRTITQVNKKFSVYSSKPERNEDKTFVKGTTKTTSFKSVRFSTDNKLAKPTGVVLYDVMTTDEQFSNINVNKKKELRPLTQDKYFDDKIFNAYVYLRRIDGHAYLIKNSNDSHKANTVNNNINNNKNKRETKQKQKKQYNFDNYIQRKNSQVDKDFFINTNKTKKRDDKRNIQKTVKTASFKPIRFSDMKLRKKAVVVLYDIMTTDGISSIFNIKTNKSKNLSKKHKSVNTSTTSAGRLYVKENANKSLENRSKKRLDEKRQKSSLKRKPSKSDEFTKRDTKTKKNRKEEKRVNVNKNDSIKNNLLLAGRLNRNFLSSNDVTSSILSFNDVHEPYNKRGDAVDMQKQPNKENKFQYSGYCINSYTKPVNKTNHTVTNNSTQPAKIRRRTISESLSARNSVAQYLAGPQFQEDIEDNRVTSTQDNIPSFTVFDRSSNYPLRSDVDIQNNYIDTTLEESNLHFNGTGLENSFQQRKLLTKNSDDRPEPADLPTTTTILDTSVETHDPKSVSNVDPLKSQQEYAVENNPQENIVNDKTVQHEFLNFSSETDSRHDDNFQNNFPADQNAKRTEVNFDSSKTYSSLNFTKTIFVPPEIVKIIEAENPFV